MAREKSDIEYQVVTVRFPKEIYQEYHALIVEHAKKYYSKKPYGTHCPLAARK